jgi:hypothetical protein
MCIFSSVSYHLQSVRTYASNNIRALLMPRLLLVEFPRKWPTRPAKRVSRNEYGLIQAQPEPERLT